MSCNDSEKNHEAILKAIMENKGKLDMLIEKLTCLENECGTGSSKEKHEEIFKVLENNSKMLAEINEWILTKHPKV